MLKGRRVKVSEHRCEDKRRKRRKGWREITDKRKRKETTEERKKEDTKEVKEEAGRT